MNPIKYVGSRSIRLATVALAIAAAAGFAIVLTPGKAPPAWLKPVTLAFAFATAASSVFCFRAVYGGWMRLAKMLNAVATLALFGTIYVVVVPLFVVPARWLDRLRLGRSRNGETTFWIQRSPADVDLASLERMS
jgi:hypothetical protein